MEPEEERAILAAVIHGDKEQFEAIVREYQGRALAVALSLVGNRHDALDGFAVGNEDSWRPLIYATCTETAFEAARTETADELDVGWFIAFSD